MLDIFTKKLLSIKRRNMRHFDKFDLNKYNSEKNI